MEIIGVSRLLSVVASMRVMDNLTRFAIPPDTTLHKLYHNLYISGPIKEAKNLYPIVATVRDEDSVISRYYVVLHDESHGYDNHLISIGLIFRGVEDSDILIHGGDPNLYSEIFLESLDEYLPDPDRTYRIVPHISIEDRPVIGSDLFWVRINDLDEDYSEQVIRSAADPPSSGLSIEA